MKKFIPIFLLISLLNASQVFGQELALQIDNSRTKKEKTITPNKGILVITKDGKRHKGKFTIVDESHIAVNGNVISLDEIQKIRRNSLGINIAKWAIIGLGSFYIGAGLIVSSGIGTIITSSLGSTLITVGFLLPNFSNSANLSYCTYSITLQTTN